MLGGKQLTANHPCMSPFDYNGKNGLTSELMGQEGKENTKFLYSDETDFPH